MTFDNSALRPAQSTGTAGRLLTLAGSAAMLALLTLSAPALAGGSKVACDKAGPQAPRDIDSVAGSNTTHFDVAPPASEMTLCDIHFHRNAEHRASGYSKLIGDGDHKGYICNGSTPGIGHAGGHGDAHHAPKGCAGIAAGDTVEVHWVFTTCDVAPGPTLGSCFTKTCSDPQLRVEARVFNLTDDGSGANFADFRAPKAGDKVTVPPASDPVQYLGSTTGSSYNDGSCSPFKVTWNVTSACAPLEIGSINGWCGKDENPFKEDHAHGVRLLVEDAALLSPIK